MTSLLDYANDSERRALEALALSRGKSLDELLVTSTATASTLSPYERFKRRQAAKANRESLTGRDIGELPEVVDAIRRAGCAESLRAFCETYLPQRFTLAWSADHLTAISRMETAIRQGGLFALAMPRGNGKTTLVESAALWAILYGYRRFVLVVAASAKASKNILKSIKAELSTNELLAADFPEAVFPIQSLGGIAHKCRGQLYRGEQTHIEWGSEAVVLARIDGAKCSQAIVKVAGLLSADVRGSKHKRANGEIARPDFIIPDDPQTDKSAKSERETAARKSIVAGALLGVAGPGKTIAGVMPCTVIRRGDLADFALDRKRSPRWQGERFKMLHGVAKNQAALDEYAELRTAEFGNGGDGSQANAYWFEHQSTLEDGYRASWPERKLPTEVSAIQHAVNLRLDNAAVFDAEYQNEPQDIAAESDLLTSEQITTKQASTPRGQCGLSTEHVTAFIDVQDDALFWLTVAWQRGFGGTILDYDVFPQFGRSQFRLLDLQGHLTRHMPGLGQEARWHKAIVQLGSYLATKEWERPDGTTIRAGKVLVDSAYGKSTDTVYEAVRACGVQAVQCSRGSFYGASSIPMSDGRPRAGRRTGVHWFEDSVDRRVLRCVTIDTNWWKSFVQARLATPTGDRGAITLYKSEPYRHALLAEHLTAEYRQRMKSHTTGREADEWKQKPGRPDNHWLDCLVGCAVGASMLGVSVEGGKTAQAGTPRVSFAELQRRAREGRR